MLIGNDVVVLERDDSVVYRSSQPHRLVADPATGARILFAATPPSF